MLWQAGKRRLYRGGRPGALARLLNRGFAALHARGIGPRAWVTLEVVGHRTGRSVRLPLVMPRVGGERYLVSMLGRDATWVANVRAAGGRAVLHHRGAERVELEELPVAQRAPILKAYLQIAPGARPHLPVAVDAPLDAYAAIAGEYPVFRVRSRSGDATPAG